MKATRVSIVLGVFARAIAALAHSSTALARRPGGGGGGGCPRDILCADIYDPVICSDGVVYGNACYAFRECATGCVPYGDGGPVEAIGQYDEIYTDGTTLEASGLRACPRDIQCPDVYNPVTCSNGITYPNACYAFRACATGCGGGGGT